MTYPDITTQDWYTNPDHVSAYTNLTSDEREALAANRKPWDEPARCGSNFSNVDSDCDLQRSHICGISERSQMFTKFFQEAYATN